ncbi:MAG: EutN/CcmL family microcompartment protein [Candidatus Hodarchaeales archaeon]|jgi:ethanolamine utilization protein EutN
MILAKVIGNVVAPIKTKSHENGKILVVRPIDLKGRFTDPSIIALDVAQAGIGDCVLVIREGNSIRSIMHDGQAAVDALIIGVVDYVQVDGKQTELC